jgi:hypothetical protein
MTADEWNSKHPIGTRFLRTSYLGGVFCGFTTKKCINSLSDHTPFVIVKYRHREIETYAYINEIEPISAYDGDMYAGKLLKEVKHEND